MFYFWQSPADCDLRLMHGIQQYELDPDGQAGVPILEVHNFEASIVYDLGN